MLFGLLAPAAALGARLARRLACEDMPREALERLVGGADHAPVSVMHVCGSHEQAIAKIGLRAAFPRELQVIMGPG